MKKYVFIINGPGGVGKDTFVSMVADASNGLVENYSSIDKVKEVARFIGWDGAKTERDRKFLSDLKQLCIAYNDMPLKDLQEKVSVFNASDKHIMFLHIREPQEIEKAVRAFSAITILLTRKSVAHITSNHSDGDVFNYEYDVEIDADCSLEELAQKASVFYTDCANENLKNKY